MNARPYRCALCGWTGRGHKLRLCRDRIRLALTDVLAVSDGVSAARAVSTRFVTSDVLSTLPPFARSEVSAPSEDAPTPTATCPQCKAEVEDFDGFGVLAHLKPFYGDGCGYCSHPSRDDGVCGLCGQREARITVNGKVHPWPGNAIDYGTIVSLADTGRTAVHSVMWKYPDGRSGLLNPTSQPIAVVDGMSISAFVTDNA